MLEATVTPDPAFALKIKNNHLKSPQLETKLIKAMDDWISVFFHHLGSRDIKVLIENDSFKDIIAIHKEAQNGDKSSPGILPILDELINSISRFELMIPHMYISHRIPDRCENVYSGSWGPPTKLLKAFEELEAIGDVKDKDEGDIGA